MQQNYSKKTDPIQKTSKNTASSILDASSQSEALQRKADMANNAAQHAEAPRPNNTGMPDNLKSGIESLSGFSMDDVRVHYNSSKPATVQALAYTQGTDIHVAPGQEKHLPHEAWHVAQQMAGRVSPTTNINGMPVNDNAGLEHEADVMGEKAVGQRLVNTNSPYKHHFNNTTAQLLSVLEKGTTKPRTFGTYGAFYDYINGLNPNQTLTIGKTRNKAVQFILQELPNPTATPQIRDCPISTYSELDDVIQAVNSYSTPSDPQGRTMRRSGSTDPVNLIFNGSPTDRDKQIVQQNPKAGRIKVTSIGTIFHQSGHLKGKLIWQISGDVVTILGHYNHKGKKYTEVELYPGAPDSITY